jgi:hypothetical protein
MNIPNKRVAKKNKTDGMTKNIEDFIYIEIFSKITWWVVLS